MPRGVNLVTRPAGDVGVELLANPRVRKVSFTGATEVGKELMEQCAHTLNEDIARAWWHNS